MKSAKNEDMASSFNILVNAKAKKKKDTLLDFIITKY